MIFRILWVLTFVVVIYAMANADEGFNLSGIMNGSAPSAIINDRIVGIRDNVDGCQILEIGADHVVCQGPGGIVNLRLKEAAAAQAPAAAKNETSKPVAKPAKQVNSPAGKSIEDGPADVQARKLMERSVVFLKEGAELLRSPMMFERLYAKAAELCDEADREAQGAFRLASGDALKAGIKNHIDKVRQAKDIILKEKADFNTRIRSLVSAKQILTGMTQQNVNSSWGPPLIRNRDGEVEKWVYQDNSGYQKELVFKGGILVSF